MANQNTAPCFTATLFVLLITTHFSFGACAANRNVFILAGQSNMAGRGGVRGGKWDGSVPPECKPNPSIFRLTAQLRWEEAHEPLHADIDVGKTCGVGPGMAFANEVLRVKGGEVGLVPCAVGGTKIGEWGRGTRLYKELVRRAGESVRGGGIIRAVLWYQGESDSVRKEDAEGYKGKLERFIMDLRCDLHIPNLPVILVAVASGEGQFVHIVRKAQLEIKLPNVKCVDAKGLRLKEDRLHLTTTSQVHLGGTFPVVHCSTKEKTWTQIEQRTSPCQETIDAAVTKVVDTVDFRSPAGEDKTPKKEAAKVVHEIKDGSGSATGGGVLGGASAAVTNTFESAKGLGAGAFESAKGAGATTYETAKGVTLNTFESAKGISASTFQSAKDAVSGTGKDAKTTK